MDGDKEVCIGVICKGCFLLDGLTDVSGSCIDHIVSVSCKDCAYRIGQTQGVIAFPSAVEDSAGVGQAVVPGVNYDSVYHEVS